MEYLKPGELEMGLEVEQGRRVAGEATQTLPFSYPKWTVRSSPLQLSKLL